MHKVLQEFTMGRPGTFLGFYFVFCLIFAKMTKLFSNQRLIFQVFLRVVDEEAAVEVVVVVEVCAWLPRLLSAELLIWNRFPSIKLFQFTLPSHL